MKLKIGEKGKLVMAVLGASLAGVAVALLVSGAAKVIFMWL